MKRWTTLLFKAWLVLLIMVSESIASAQVIHSEVPIEIGQTPPETTPPTVLNLITTDNATVMYDDDPVNSKSSIQSTSNPLVMQSETIIPPPFSTILDFEYQAFWKVILQQSED